MKKLILVILFMGIFYSLGMVMERFVRNAFPNEMCIKNINVSTNVDYIKGEIIVKFRDCNQPYNRLRSIGTHRHFHRQSNSMMIRLHDESDDTDVLKELSNNANIEYATHNYRCRAHARPNDPLYHYQWNFNIINMEHAWERQQRGKQDIVVAVLDTGIAYENYTDYKYRYRVAPDLVGTIFCYPYDFVNGDFHPNDDNGHGTHVTGTICQNTNNAYGVAGIINGITIMPVKVLDFDNNGSSFQLANGIYWAVNHGANIINMSLGFPPNVSKKDIPSVTDAIKYAYDRGVIIVASSGNDGVDSVSLPAAYNEVIAVGATNSLDILTSYSQYGNEIEIVAPGGELNDRNEDGNIDGIIQETFEYPEFENFSFWAFIGTSMATPHVTGVIALLLSQDSSRTIVDIREILHNTSVDLGEEGWDKYYGYGRINAFDAITYNYPNVFVGEGGCFVNLINN